MLQQKDSFVAFVVTHTCAVISDLELLDFLIVSSTFQVKNSDIYLSILSQYLNKSTYTL